MHSLSLGYCDGVGVGVGVSRSTSVQLCHASVLDLFRSVITDSRDVSELSEGPIVPKQVHEIESLLFAVSLSLPGLIISTYSQYRQWFISIRDFRDHGKLDPTRHRTSESGEKGA